MAAHRMSDKFWTPDDDSSQFSLTREEKDENANRVYTFFFKIGWTKEAICGMLGNMDVESRMNPRAENQGADSYGLVQWHPASKLQLWAAGEGLNWELGTTQCKRIKFEEENNLQWASWSDYTFSYWAREMVDTPDEMAKIFMERYEVADPGTLEERKMLALYYFEVVKLISEISPAILVAILAKKHKLIGRKRIKL